MRILRRAQLDAYCGAPATLYQRVAGVLSPVMLLVSIVIILILWHKLPEQIPTHYNAAGQIDGYDTMPQELTCHIHGDEVGLVGGLVVATHHGNDESAWYGCATYALEHSFYGLTLAQSFLAGFLRGKAYLGIYESLLM